MRATRDGHPRCGADRWCSGSRTRPSSAVDSRAWPIDAGWSLLNLIRGQCDAAIPREAVQVVAGIELQRRHAQPHLRAVISQRSPDRFDQRLDILGRDVSFTAKAQRRVLLPVPTSIVRPVSFARACLLRSTSLNVSAVSGASTRFFSRARFVGSIRTPPLARGGIVNVRLAVTPSSLGIAIDRDLAVANLNGAAIHGPLGGICAGQRVF